MNNRVAIFIDGEYMRLTLASEFNRRRVDFQKLSAAIKGDAEILRTYFYTCLPYVSNSPTEEVQERFNRAARFHDALRMLSRFEVRLGRLEYRGRDADGRPRFEQKRVDILLGVDLVQLAAKGHIQEAILIAGDSDFIPAISVAKSEGVIVRLFHGSQCHDDLRREVDERVAFDMDLIESAAPD